MALPEDLEQIDRSIRQLQIEWEKFFGGVERKPPNELKARVEALIRAHANAEIRNNTDRFRYQNLSARYNTFNEMWGKRLRALEEGRVMPARHTGSSFTPDNPLSYFCGGRVATTSGSEAQPTNVGPSATRKPRMLCRRRGASTRFAAP